MLMIYIYVGVGIHRGLVVLRRPRDSAILIAALVGAMNLCFAYTNRARTPAEWAWRHSLWHVAVFGLALAAHLVFLE